MKSVFYFCNRAGYIDDKLSNLKVCIMRIPSPEGSESLHSPLNKTLTEIERNTCHNLTWILFAIVTRRMAMQLWAAGHIGAEHEHEDRAGGGIPDIRHLEGGRGLASVIGP